jgi:tetratricopeptide (TPR) repeat protein
MKDEKSILCFIALLLVTTLIVSCSTHRKSEGRTVRVLDSIAMADDYYERGCEQYSFDDLEYALALFDSSIAFRPNDARVWERKGSTLGRMMRHTEAQLAFDRSLSLNPKLKSALWHRACDYAVSGDKEHALAFLRKTIAQDTNFKQGALEDECFMNLWQDEDFRKLVQ